jgi:hypothetical protein
MPVRTQIEKNLKISSSQIANPQICQEKGSVSYPDPNWVVYDIFLTFVGIF